MLPLYLALTGTAMGLGLFFWSVRRTRAPIPREAAIHSSIGDLTRGRFHIRGRVVPIRTTPSEIDGSACVYVERAHYAHVGGLVPLLREVDHGYVAHRFFIDDGSGRVLVDPAESLIDCAVASGDGGLTAERRLRAGEDIELVASFRVDEQIDPGDLDGPYRAARASWRPEPDACGPPRISFRTEDGMERAGLDDVNSFLRGAGVLMVAMSLFFAGVMLWLHGFHLFAG
jgi:hypothetical protein